MILFNDVTPNVWESVWRINIHIKGGGGGGGGFAGPTICDFHIRSSNTRKNKNLQGMNRNTDFNVIF